jgi:hypothetical protein
LFPSGTPVAVYRSAYPWCLPGNAREIGPVKFDHVVTVCGHANESCPVFLGKTQVVHVGFDDPPKLTNHLPDGEEKLDVVSPRPPPWRLLPGLSFGLNACACAPVKKDGDRTVRIRAHAIYFVK